MLRHPAEIVASARKSYGTWQTEASRAAAWLNVTLETERATRGARRAFVRYEDLLADWQAEIDARRRARSACRCSRPSTATAVAAGRRVRRPDAAPQPRRAGTTLDVPAARARAGRATSGSGCSRSRRPAATPPARRPRSTPRASAYGALYAEAEAIAQSSITAAQAARHAQASQAAPPPPASLRVRVARRDPEALPRAACAARSARCACARSMAAVPRISVVVPIYNVERYLEACLESVAAQTFGDLEVVMVDDGSTDGSAAIAEAFAAPRRRASGSSRQPNGGLERGPQHGHRRRDRRVPRLRRLRRRAAAERLRAAARRARARPARTSPPATSPPHARAARRRRRFLAQAFAETRLKTHVTQVPAAARRPHGLEQALAPVVLGRARLPLPRGPRSTRTSRWSLPAALRARVGRRDRRARLPAGASARAATSRSPQRRLERARCSTACTAIEDGQRLPRAPRARGGPSAGTTRASSPTTCATTSTSLDSADDEYRELFLDRVNAFLDGASDRVFDAAAGDRAAQVAPRPPPADARAARGAALPARGASADTPPVRIARPLVRRLPVPDRPAAEASRARSTGSTRSSRCAPRSTTLRLGRRGCGSRAGPSSTGIGAPRAGRAAASR